MSTEAMQQAMEALKESIDVPCYGGHPKQEAAHHALREAIANEALDRMAENARELGLDYEPAQQEPVAWVDLIKEADEIVRGKVLWKRFIDGTPLANDISCWMADFAQRYTSPPAQRTWVGLTRRERFEIEKAMSKYYDYQHECKTVCLPEFAAAIEAKLKEKNND